MLSYTLGMLRESCRVGIVVRFTSGMMMESFVEGVLLSVVPLTCQANLVQEGNVILCTMLRESCRMGIIRCTSGMMMESFVEA
mgnify:CR=1 FL=1